MLKQRPSVLAKVLAVVGTGLVPVLAVAGAAQADEVTVTVTSVRTLDKVDELSGGDFYARVTIAGDAQSTPVVKADTNKTFKPDWKITKTVPAGTTDVKLELIDKDLADDDPVDINRLSNKRSLEFTVNTKTGKIDGFQSPYKTGKTITRAGTEKKKAEISFKVTVKK